MSHVYFAYTILIIGPESRKGHCWNQKDACCCL